jgi:hypothetical protein
MLHDSDNKMILFDDTAPNSLFALDIERGKVVEEWKVNDYVPVNHIAPKDKYAQTTGEQTVVGISGNALYRIDPRLSGNKMVQNEMKQYASKTKFSGVTTTGSGKLAVAGDKGDIRLFDSIGKNAKTALPALGDPILGIDVSGDGRWIVATTKTYLLLIDTMIGDGKYAGSLGFDRAFPADAKPIPRRLQLRAEHVAYMNDSISFTPARYAERKPDIWVRADGTTTLGSIWERTRRRTLSSLQLGSTSSPGTLTKSRKGTSTNTISRSAFYPLARSFAHCLCVFRYEDRVVQDNFKFGNDKEIVRLGSIPAGHVKAILTYSPADCGASEQRSGIEQEAAEATDTSVSRSGASGSEPLRYCQQPLVILSLGGFLGEGKDVAMMYYGPPSCYRCSK